MKIYAEKPWRLTRQILADLTVFVWSALWIWAAITLYQLLLKLGVPGEKLESAGDSLAGNLDDAQDKAKRIPLVGDEVSAPFGDAADAARNIAEAGRSQQEAVGDLSLVLAFLVAGIPVLLVLVLWLPLRVIWIRSASAAVRLRARSGGTELLALRALVKAPLRKLATLDDDVIASWRTGDPAAVNELATVELKRLGLRGDG